MKFIYNFHHYVSIKSLSLKFDVENFVLILLNSEHRLEYSITKLINCI